MRYISFTLGIVRLTLTAGENGEIFQSGGDRRKKSSLYWTGLDWLKFVLTIIEQLGKIRFLIENS